MKIFAYFRATASKSGFGKEVVDEPTKAVFYGKGHFVEHPVERTQEPWYGKVRVHQILQ